MRMELLKIQDLNKNGNEDFSLSDKEKKELTPKESENLFKETQKDDYLKEIIKNTSGAKPKGILQPKSGEIKF